MDLSKEKLHHLYSSGKSMTDIAKLSGCSINKVKYWMVKFGLPRRNHSDATYLKENPNGDPFDIKKSLTREDKLLFGLAMGIYLGEGNKVEKNSLRIANTDPRIHKLFLRFLFTICRLDRNRLSASIICFNDTDPELAREFWSRQLNISPSKFGKITQIPPQGKGIYKRKSKFGVCIIQANNGKLTKWFRDRVNSLET